MSATLEELASQLRARWDRDLLAVYGDLLMMRGDPRGELIALDLELEACGSTPELEARRTRLLMAA